MPERQSLDDEIAAVFARACDERDWEAAEYLLQALEAIARRESDDSRVERALQRLVERLSAQHH